MDFDLLEVAAAWSLWERTPAPAIPRRVELPVALSSERCLVIQGVRRCGKSTLMRQLVRHYELDPRRCLFMNFEDPRLASLLTHEVLEALVEQFVEREGAAEDEGAPLVFFLDEIQVVVGWERWLRSQLDRKTGHVFVVSGSNANLLSGELSSALTGRHLTVELYPFDFAEFRAVEPNADVSRFLREGGFPEPLGDSDGDRLRRQYFNDIVERDLRERIGARSSRPVRQVLQMVYESAGSQMSLRRIAGAAGIAVETASTYVDAAQAAYLLFGVPYFAYSERKRASRNLKYYPIDPGLRRVCVRPGSEDRGKSLECAVFLVLKKRFGQVSYWYDDGEVDFVVEDGSTVVPVQVTWDEPQPRHDRALASFYERFPQAGEAVVITARDFESFANA